MRNKIISLVLTIAIMLQFGGSTKQTKKETACSESYVEIQDPSFDMTGSKVDLAEYIKAINSIDVEYNFEQSHFYNFLIMTSVGEDEECTFQYKEDYNYFDVYLQILQNSDMNLHNQHLSEAEKQVQRGLLNALTKIYYKMDASTIGDDLCYLKDVVVKIDAIDEENTLATHDYAKKLITIDFNKIKASYIDYSVEEKEQWSFEDYLENVLHHEINHGRQAPCDCRKYTDIITYRISRTNLLIEASAESETYNFYVNDLHVHPYETTIYTYSKERQAQSLILLMGMFKEGFTLDKYYQAMFNSDINAFHKLFELKSIEDYGTFYNIFYALDTIEGRTELADKLKAEGIDTRDELKAAVGNDYKIDVFKIVVEDLIRKINKESLSLKESMKLYSLVKLLILNDEHKIEFTSSVGFMSPQYIQYGDYLYYYDEAFLMGIGKLDEIFIQFLSDYYKITKNNIDELFNDHEFSQEMLCLLSYFGYSSAEAAQENFVANYSFIEKYPLITELLFCNDSIIYANDYIFNESYKRKLTIEKLQNN